MVKTRKKHKILAIEDNPDVGTTLCTEIEMEGHEPIWLKTYQEAQNFIAIDPSTGRSRLDDIGFIICDNQLGPARNSLESGIRAAEQAKMIDSQIPTYLYSGVTPTDAELFMLSKGTIDGILNKVHDRELLRKIIREGLADHVQIDLPFFVFKKGGSTEDYNLLIRNSSVYKGHFTDSLLYLAILRQMGIVPLTNPGGGPMWDVEKAREEFNPGIEDGKSYELMQPILDRNAKYIANIINKLGVLGAIAITPYDLRKVEILPTGEKIYRTLKDYINTGLVPIISGVPRHLFIGYSEDYRGDSDSVTSMLARYVRSPKTSKVRIVVEKLTDGIYREDPLKHFDQLIATDPDSPRAQTLKKEWSRYHREHNEYLPSVTSKEIKDGKTEDGKPISMRGAGDGKIGHFYHPRGLDLIEEDPRIEMVVASHIAPLLFHPDGTHFQKGTAAPANDNKTLRESNMRNAIFGTPTEGIIRNYNAAK